MLAIRHALEPVAAFGNGGREGQGRAGKGRVIEAEHRPGEPECDDDPNHIPRPEITRESDAQAGPGDEDGGQSPPHGHTGRVDLWGRRGDNLIHDAADHGGHVGRGRRVGRNGRDELEHQHEHHQFPEKTGFKR